MYFMVYRLHVHVRDLIGERGSMKQFIFIPCAISNMYMPPKNAVVSMLHIYRIYSNRSRTLNSSCPRIVAALGAQRKK